VCERAPPEDGILSQNSWVGPLSMLYGVLTSLDAVYRQVLLHPREQHRIKRLRGSAAGQEELKRLDRAAAKADEQQMFVLGCLRLVAPFSEAGAETGLVSQRVKGTQGRDDDGFSWTACQEGKPYFQVLEGICRESLNVLTTTRKLEEPYMPEHLVPVFDAVQAALEALAAKSEGLRG